VDVYTRQTKCTCNDITDRRLSLCLCFANDVVVKEGADDIRVEVSLILHTNRDNLDYELS